MIKNLSDLIVAARSRGPATVAVAAAEDAEVIEAVREVASLGLANAILVGNEASILALAGEAGLPRGARIIREPDPKLASLAAARLVRQGEASLLMKGAVNTSDFLRAALDAENGLRSGRMLSHLAAVEIPGESKLVFYSDGGMNVAPSLAEKKQILGNALSALQLIGISEPKVAILAANEQVSAKVVATTDAKALMDAWENGEFPGAVIEGPIAFDVATSREAAEHKKIVSRIAGETDLFIFPSIEAGNIATKALMRYAGARMAGVILGATHPIVLVSRADNAAAKVSSVALACLAVNR